MVPGGHREKQSSACPEVIVEFLHGQPILEKFYLHFSWKTDLEIEKDINFKEDLLGTLLEGMLEFNPQHFVLSWADRDSGIDSDDK